jgi:hypothetical protein
MIECKCGKPTKRCYDPYDEVVLDKKTIITVCVDCYNERIADMEIWLEHNNHLMFSAYVGHQIKGGI